MTRPAKRLGRYDLLRRLAAGGMGEVYLAEAEGAANFTKQVAIKRILPHLAEDEGFVRKFIDEAHLMVQLHHGNIVPVLELADDGGELYIVMEYLPGRDLKAVLRRLRADQRVMPVDLAVWLATEVLAGLDYAHRKRSPDGEPLGVVHRDVSPSNICLGGGGEVKLVDFGIARARGGLHQSISGTLQGKFVYMSPEQADGRAIDGRSDIFSAALVLYELLTDRRPFEGDTETETLRRVRECRVERPSTVRPDVPPALDEIVMRALAVDPADRYPTAGEMRRVLSHHLAVTGSDADASAFARFLAEVFPEGVVPQRESSPRSFDDALLMQLDGTGSRPEGTRTASAPAERASAERARVAGRTPTGPQSRTPTAFARTAAGGPEAEDSGAASLDPLTPANAPVLDALTPASAVIPVTFDRRRTDRPAGPGSTGLGSPTAPTSPASAANSTSPATSASAASSTGPIDRSTIPATATDHPLHHPTDRPAGRRRTLILGLLIGLGIAAVATLWPRDATLRPQITPDLADAWIEVDGARLSDGATLVAGRPYRICATAPDHAPDCRQITLSAGQNRPAFELTPAPVLAPIVEPADLDARLTLDGVEIRQPRFPLIAGQSYAVCASAPGYTEACERFAATAGVNAPRLALTPITPADAAVPDAATDAATDPVPTDAAPDAAPRRRGKPPVRSVTLDSLVTAEVWTADRHLGATPLEVRVEARPITYELRAEGYSPTRYTITPDHRTGPIRIALQRPARLTVRAHPPASEILLDGTPIAVGVAIEHATQPGPHTLTIRYQDKTGQTHELGPRRITLKPGETLNLGEIVVPVDGPSGEKP